MVRFVGLQYAARVCQGLFPLNIKKSELLAWSVALSQNHRVKNVNEARDDGTRFTSGEKLLNRQNVIMSKPLDSNHELLKQMAALKTAQ